MRDKPLFKDIIDEFIDYVADSPIIIHNAPFDIGFLKKEFSLIDDEKSFLKNEIIDSLKLARKNSPGKKNTLDALCERYSIDNSDRSLHGALLDAKLLAFVYLKMTIGQNNFINLTSDRNISTYHKGKIKDNFKVIEPTEVEEELHQNYFK